MLIRLSPNQRDFMLHRLDHATVQGRPHAAMLLQVGEKLENPEAGGGAGLELVPDETSVGEEE